LIEARDLSVPSERCGREADRRERKYRRRSRNPNPGFWDDAEDAAYCHTCGALSEEHLRKTIHAMNAF